MIARRLDELAPPSGTPSTKARLHSCASGTGLIRSVRSKRAILCSGVRLRLVEEVATPLLRAVAAIDGESSSRADVTALAYKSLAALRSDPMSTVGSCQVLPRRGLDSADDGPAEAEVLDRRSERLAFMSANDAFMVGSVCV